MFTTEWSRQSRLCVGVNYGFHPNFGAQKEKEKLRNLEFRP